MNGTVIQMTPYDEVFLPIFGVGCLIAFLVSFIAGRLGGLVLPGIALSLGVMSFWVSLFLGSELGYRAWQSMPDPPAVAFSDTAPLGALVFGWLPAGVFCGFVFGCSWLIKFCFTRHQRSAAILSATVVPEGRPETGDPYQPPS